MAVRAWLSSGVMASARPSTVSSPTGALSCGRIADGRAFSSDDAALIRRGLAEEERKKGRFAGAIRADEAEAFAAVDLKRGLLKKDAAAEGFGDLGYSEHAERPKEPQKRRFANG